MAKAEHLVTIDASDASASTRAEHKRRQLGEIIPIQLRTLYDHHRLVVDAGDVDSVHKMRVATRKLQASLDLLEREMSVRKLKRRLRSWRRALSEVRNYDVFLELIAKEGGARRRAHREQFELVRSILAERRENKAIRVRQYLAGAKIEEIAIALGLSAIAVSEPVPAVIEVPVAKMGEMSALEFFESAFQVNESSVISYAAERIEQRLAEFQALVAKSHPSSDPRELHELRIAAKRVRYLLEIVQQMGYGDASRALAWLRALQDRIGDWHDLEALEAETIRIVARGSFMKDYLMESSRLLQAAAHLRKKKEILVAKLFPVRVPQTVIQSTQRIARALRRESIPRAAGPNPSA